MQFLLLFGVVAAFALAASQTVHDFSLNTIDGKAAPLSAYKGKVLLLVNVASKCGYTPQYTGLESLYRKYKDRGLVVVGFPANDFGSQEPGTNEEIKEFCTRKYDVTFPMYSKISVKGDAQAPLYKFLQEKAGPVNWNFNKFLVDANGNVVKRFDSRVTPDAGELTGAIEQVLPK